MTSPYFGNVDYSFNAGNNYNSFSTMQQQQQPHQQNVDPSIYGYGHVGTDIGTWNAQMNAQTTQPALGSYSGGFATQPQYNSQSASNYGPIGQPVPTRGPSMRGRGNSMRGRGMFKPKPTGPRPIKATEIKAWLFEWCTQKKLKPEYSFEAKGKYPKVRYICTLNVTGIDYKAQKEAKNKKEAQTQCAWDFCEKLVEFTHIQASNLPKKPDPDAPAGSATGSVVSTSANTGSTGGSEMGLEENGGWTVENARRRLNEFCMEERISCEFETSSQGTLYSHIAISKLTLNIKRAGGVLTQSAQASNKKTANAQCALNMIRELYRRGLIEKFGEKRISSARMSDVESPLALQAGVTPLAMQAEDNIAGQKRKVDDGGDVEFDENGNWTLELARSRLSEFFQKQGKQLNCDEKEFGGPFNKQFQCSCEITIDSKEFKAEARASNKKSAQKKCALDMVIQLYRAGLIPGNAGKRSKDLSVKRQKKDGRSAICEPGLKLNSPLVVPKWGTGRTTPYDDRHIRTKLENLEQTDLEKSGIETVMQEINAIMKTVVEKMAAEEKPAEDVKMEAETENEENEEKLEKPAPTLDGPITLPFPIGAFAKGLMLKGEKNPHLVLQCKEKPTVILLKRVSQELQTLADPKGFRVMEDVRNACIKIVKDVNGIDIPVVMTFTSIKMRPNPDNPAETPDPADILPRNKCLEALAEQRRAKFFQQRAAPNANCIAICRILKDLMIRSSDFTGLSEWAMELIAQKALESSPYPLTAGDALRRVFASIASGLLLPGGTGIRDLCERDEADACGNLTKQEREDITYLSQAYLRQISFMQIHVLLGIDKLDK